MWNNGTKKKRKHQNPKQILNPVEKKSGDKEKVENLNVYQEIIRICDDIHDKTMYLSERYNWGEHILVELEICVR